MPEAHLVGGALAPDDVPLSAGPAKAGSRSRSHCTCRQVTLTVSNGVEVHRADRLGALVVEVPDRDVEHGPRPRACRGWSRCVIERPSRCMWPATPSTVIGRGDVPGARGDLARRPARSPQSRWSRSAVTPGPSPKRSLTSATAASRSQSGAASWPGRQGSSTGAGSRNVCSGVRSRRARAIHRSCVAEVSGSSATEQVVVDLHHDPGARARAATPYPSRRERLPRRPAPRRPASWRRRGSRSRPRARCRRSRSSPRRASAASLASASATWSGSTRNRITWWTTSGLPGSTLVPVRKTSCVELRVEQEAAVVVGADAVRRRGRVRLRHPSASSAARPSRQRRQLGRRGAASGWASTSGGRGGGRAATRGRRPAAGAGPEPLAPQRGQRAARHAAASAAAARAAAPATRARGGHPGGQVIGAAGEQVHVGVEDALADALAGVEDQAVVVVALGGGDRRGRGDQLGGRLGVAGGERRRRSGSGRAARRARASAPAR